MSLKEGTRVGPYEIGPLLGAGGMGEVYRARDTRLDRDAALKILPDSFAGDADRLARFEREAKTLAALNHPHIAAIYGLEDGPTDPVSSGSSRTRVLAMELVEGEDLSAILARGPLPLDETLPIARQIAEALEAAHAQGVIHRDLKPANIKVRPDGTVKVLDFGLAKATDVKGAVSGSLANSPTITSPAGMTRAGVILGTAAYMAPEQARGRVVDSRADVWAFGCVLFEMLTGQQAFDGEDITAVLAKVIEREPDWTLLPPRTPAIVTRLLHRALNKDRAKRLQHMGDARLDLDEALSMPSEEPASHAAATISPTSWSRLALALAATLAVGVALGVVAAGYWPRASAPGPRALQFDIPLVGAGASRFTLSADGRYLAYFAPGSGGFDVWLRDLSRAAAERIIENADSASWLAWSGDARSLFAGVTGGLRRFDVETGASLLQRGSWPFGASRVWLSDERFLLGSGGAGLGPLAVESPTGRERALDLDATVQEVRQIFPAAVDNAGAFSYRSDRQDGSRYVCITRLDAAPARCAGPVNHDSSAWYFNGSLIYARGGTLIARAFDLETVRFSGEEQSLADGLGSQGQGIMTAASRADTLAFAVGAAGQRLVWKDRSGADTAIRSIALTTNMALSSDGRRVLVTEAGALMMLDLATGASSRLGPSLGDPIWSPDGRRLAHRTATGLVTRSVESVEERVVFDFKGNATAAAFTEDWSPDGQWLAVGLRSGDYQAALIPVGGGEPVRFIKNNEGIESADEFHFSPSGKWIAFNAISGGRSEVFVVANPPTGQRWQVSTRGGMQARWRPSSNTLHYLEQDETMMEVAVQPGEAFSVRERKALFKVGFIPSPIYDDYRVAPDGRFLIKAPVGSEALRVIVNWTALLGKKQ